MTKNAKILLMVFVFMMVDIVEFSYKLLLLEASFSYDVVGYYIIFTSYV